MYNIEQFKEKIKTCNTFIFDMDGTLVDLENLNFTTFKQIVEKEFNQQFTHNDYQTYFSGAGSRNGFRQYINGKVGTLAEGDSSKSDVELKIEDLVNRYRALKKEILYNDIKSVVTVKPFAKELLAKIKEREFKCALATSSFYEFAKFITQSFEIYDYFDHFLTERDIKKNKPDPEIFNLAVERLKSERDRSIIFEDSLNGILSAKASNVFTVALHNPGDNDLYLNKSDFVISSYKEVLDIL